ncbi:LysR family transcriptional regulator [Nocardioides sp. Soil797]|nr:LysR family transcriptional regulator [Nocardioides sp. Soil797]
MRIEQLQYITAVTEHGSLRRASASLHISQPALSEAISKLERELGVTLLDRRRSGARISRHGRELLQSMGDVLDAVGRLRTAAGDQSQAGSTIRVGSVDAATSTLFASAVRDLRRDNPQITIELVTAQQAEIEEGLAEGALDLGLVNLLDGDDTSPDLTATQLLRGRPVVVCRTDHPLADLESVSIEELHRHDLVVMRQGFVMHRFVHRILDSENVAAALRTDGAEMGKVMVAQGLGITVLPDYSVVGDPLETSGVLTQRRLSDDATGVRLMLLQRRGNLQRQPPRDLRAALIAQAERRVGATA